MDLNTLTKKQLQEKCTELGIQFKEVENKGTLIEKINSVEIVEVKTELASSEERVEEVQEDVPETEEEELEEETEILDPEEEPEIETEEEVEEESEEKLHEVYYKAKQRWVHLGEFKDEKAIKKALKKKGSKVYKIM